MKFPFSLSERFQRLSGRSKAVGMFFATSLAGRVVGVGCQLLQIPIAVKTLGPEAFGLWMTLMSVSNVITFADFGVGQGAQNHLAEAFASGRKDEAHELFGSAVAFLCIVGLFLAAAVVVVTRSLDFTSLFNLVDPTVRTEAPAAVMLTLLLFCLNFPLGLAQRLAYSLQRGWMHNIAQACAGVGALMGTLVGAHYKLPLPAFIACAQAPMVLANAGLLVLLLAQLGWQDIRRIRCKRETMRSLLGLGAYFGLQQVHLTLLLTLPQLMISTCLGAAAVTPYTLAQKVFNIFAIIQNAFMLPLWPAYSEAKARGEVSWIRRTLFLSIAATLAFVIAPMALGAAFARPIISLWVGGHAVLPSKTLVWLLFLWNGAIFLQQPFGYMLAGISEVRRLTFYAAVSGVASTVLMYVLVHSAGVEGMVFGMFVGYLPYLILGNMTETGRVFRTSMRDRRAAAPQVMEPQTVGSNT